MPDCSAFARIWKIHFFQAPDSFIGTQSVGVTVWNGEEENCWWYAVACLAECICAVTLHVITASFSLVAVKPVPAKKAESSSEDSDDSSDDDEEPPKPVTKKVAAPAPAAQKRKHGESNEDSSDDSEEEEDTKQQSVSV
jgi:hypothetical protein